MNSEYGSLPSHFSLALSSILDAWIVESKPPQSSTNLSFHAAFAECPGSNVLHIFGILPGVIKLTWSTIAVVQVFQMCDRTQDFLKVSSIYRIRH